MVSEKQIIIIIAEVLFVKYFAFVQVDVSILVLSVIVKFLICDVSAMHAMHIHTIILIGFLSSRDG